MPRSTRLSDSILWTYQARYFDRRGVRAWNESEVPHFITSNTWIAGAYARVVLGWLRDGHAAGAFDPEHPLYIVELGCGNGRFGYLFTRRLLRLLAGTPLAGLDVSYVFTDAADYNLDVLRSHASLQPLVEAGVVDFASFDASTGRELRLRHSGQILAAGSVRNPMAVLANYVFDGIPQDCFRLKAGRLHEGRALITGDHADADPAAAIRSARLAFDYRAVEGAYYHDPEWNRILAEYDALPGGSTFLFPCAALTCIRHLAELSGDRLLLLSGDIGSASLEAVPASFGSDDVAMNVHGSLSMPVNYHAIGSFIGGRGGQFLATPHVDTNLTIVAGLLGEQMAGYPETQLAYEEFIDGEGPDDFHAVKKILTGVMDSCTLTQAIGILRFSGWDHTVFLHAVPALQRSLAGASPRERASLAAALEEVWEHHFPLREPGNVALHIARLYRQLERPGDALVYAQRALALDSTDQEARSLVAALSPTSFP